MSKEREEVEKLAISLFEKIRTLKEEYYEETDKFLIKFEKIEKELIEWIELNARKRKRIKTQKKVKR